MIRETGNMFDMVDALADPHVVLVTTNSFVRKDGALVMGRGAAKQAAALWFDLPHRLGKRIPHLGTYGVITELIEDNLAVGAFQVKLHWHEAAKLYLIEQSAALLTKLAARHTDVRFDMNYPGIGNGKLAMADVDPLLANLPDNVHVWTFR